MAEVHSYPAPGCFRQSCPRRTPDRVAFAKAAQDAPRIGSLSPKQPKTHPGLGHFRQSSPRRTPDWVTFVKVAQDAPRIGSLSPKQPKMHPGLGHFRQSCPRRTPDRVTFVKVAQDAPRIGFNSKVGFKKESGFAPPACGLCQSEGESKNIRGRGSMINDPPPRMG